MRRDCGRGARRCCERVSVNSRVRGGQGAFVGGATNRVAASAGSTERRARSGRRRVRCIATTLAAIVAQLAVAAFEEEFLARAGRTRLVQLAEVSAFAVLGDEALLAGGDGTDVRALAEVTLPRRALRCGGAGVAVVAERRALRGGRCRRTECTRDAVLVHAEAVRRVVDRGAGRCARRSDRDGLRARAFFRVLGALAPQTFDAFEVRATRFAFGLRSLDTSSAR